jgi:SAM-dependent methyltransferase
MSIDLSKVKKLYSDNIKEFGIDPKSVGWGTKNKQNLRFEKLMEIVLDRNSPFSVNELGCGYGEMVKYCNAQKILLSAYYGYDLSAEMVDAAETYIGAPNVSLFQSGKLKTIADYTIASGIFNVKFEEQRHNWEEYVLETIKHLFESSTIGISFNFLTKYVDWEQDDLYYADPFLIFDYCKKELSKKVNLIHDYNLFEFTIHVLK